MRVKDMPASVTDSLDSLDAAMDAIGHDRLEQGCFRKCAETTRANTWGHESFQVQKASVDTKSLRPCCVTRDGRERAPWAGARVCAKLCL
jgi:hypothetical protein